MNDTNKCPKCGHVSDLDSQECPKCGVVVEKFLEKEKTRQRQKKLEETEKKLKEAEEKLEQAERRSSRRTTPLKPPILFVVLVALLLLWLGYTGYEVTKELWHEEEVTVSHEPSSGLLEAIGGVLNLLSLFSESDTGSDNTCSTEEGYFKMLYEAYLRPENDAIRLYDVKKTRREWYNCMMQKGYSHESALQAIEDAQDMLIY